MRESSSYRSNVRSNSLGDDGEAVKGTALGGETGAAQSRDSAAGIALVFPEVAERLRPLLDAADRAYQEALHSEASLTASSREPRELESVIAAFDEAERAATLFCNRAEGRVEPRQSERATSKRLAFSLVWEGSVEPGR